MSLQFSSLLVLVLLMNACRSQEILTDPLPADLQVSGQIDSIITVNHQDYFSQVSPAGEGPKGALIRWNLETAYYKVGSFTTLTYNEQNQVVGMFDYNWGSEREIVKQAQYLGGYLASVRSAYLLKSPSRDIPRSHAYLESLKKDLITLQPSQVIKYQYDEHRQVARRLTYGRIRGTDKFKLEFLSDYEYTYGPADQLQQIRETRMPGNGPTTIIYDWQNGDIIREESIYSPNEFTSGLPVTQTYGYGYGKEVNPFARFSFIYFYNFLSQHDRVSITYDGDTDQFVPIYRYDTQGRMSYYNGYTLIYAP